MLTSEQMILKASFRHELVHQKPIVAIWAVAYKFD